MRVARQNSAHEPRHYTIRHYLKYAAHFPKNEQKLRHPLYYASICEYVININELFNLLYDSWILVQAKNYGDRHLLLAGFFRLKICSKRQGCH